ncbi:hypothetical protein BDQ17DRAFT_1436575 [Cyathus striatus]|nr:hypothetical protein BDQ17DRAFT_1436575 [Cyathus striatus]
MSSRVPLPTDTIIDIAHILTATHDLGTLTVLTRTCKSVLEPLQKLIFASIDLRSGPYVHERCTLLRRALSSSSHLSTYVKEIRITDIAGGYSEGADVPPWTPHNPDLPQILSLIVHPETFELSVPLQPITWDEFSDEFCGSLFRLFTRPTLSSISITGVKDLPAALISRCAGLRHLCLRNGTVFITTLPGYFATLGLSEHIKSISNLEELRLSAPTKVESLELVDMGNVEFLLDTPNRPAEFTFSRLFADDEAKAEFLLDRESLFPDFSGLKKISVRQSSFPEVSNTWKVIGKASESLRTLSWEFIYGRSPGVDNIPLHEIPHLRTLDFRISVPAMDIYLPFRGFTPSHPLTPLNQLLSSVLPDPPPSEDDSPREKHVPSEVSTINITLDCTIFDDIPPKVKALFANDPAWSTLNTVLRSKEHFPPSRW